MTIDYSFQALVNDPDATARTGAAFRAAFGDQGVADPGLITGSEDVPAFAAGTLDSGIPSNHSPSFAPQLHPTLKHGVEALVVAAREWLDRRRRFFNAQQHTAVRLCGVSRTARGRTGR